MVVAAPPSRKWIWIRWLLAGPWAILGSILVMCALAVILPPGPGRVDNLVLPLVLFPLIWAVAFFHAVLSENLLRSLLLNLVVGVSCVGILVARFLA